MTSTTETSTLFPLSPLLKLFIVAIQNFCYHGNVTSHFSSLLDLFPIFFCRFRCRRRLALLSVSVIHGPFNLEKVLILLVVLKSLSP